jgi:predicted aconitase
MDLEAREQQLLKGHEGPAMQLAMELVVQAARILCATELVPVSFAHIDACFYNGEAHVDFAQFCLDHGARFAVSSWSNNGVVSATHPELYAKTRDPEMVDGARRLMALYDKLGCKPVWTCAPYQLPGGPKFGDQIVAGESNAVTFYNSVTGARTNKYGDYLDVACALVGKAPYAGLHTDEGRRATLHFDVSSLPEILKESDVFHHLLGHHVGRVAGRRIPVISGLSSKANTDDLKAISTAVAASGGVELWHGVGATPEARYLSDVFDGGDRHDVTTDDLHRAARELSVGQDGPLDVVALGTPHFSATEFQRIVALLKGRKVASSTRLVITTSRFVEGYIRSKGWVETLETSGVTIVCDICSYYAPGLDLMQGRVMTNSAKWAYYAPGMLPVDVCFGSLRECVESAVRGNVWRDAEVWNALS